MSEHGLRRDMIECGLLPPTGTAADATAALRALRREARAARRRPRASRVGPVLAVLLTVVLATTAVVVSWSALAVLPIVVGLAVLLASASRTASPRGTTPDIARSARSRPATRPTFR